MRPPEAVARGCSVKKMLLKISQNSQENNCVGVFLQYSCRAEALHFTKKETPTQVLSCELCENFKNTFFIEQLRWLLLDHVGYSKTC